MRHPLEAVIGGWRLGAVVALAVTALAVRGKMHVHAKTQAAPHGMMSYAGAGDPATARRIVASWDRGIRDQADLNLRLDPLFSLAWTNAIALADLWAGRVLRAAGRPGAEAGVPLAWGQWLAGALATAKDAALLAMLRGNATPPLPTMAPWCTISEIGLKTAGLVYAAVGGWPGWSTGTEAAATQMPRSLHRPRSPPMSALREQRRPDHNGQGVLSMRGPRTRASLLL